MEFHPDFDKLDKIHDLVNETYPLKSEIKKLNEKIAANKKIINGPGKFNFSPITHNFDRAMEKESARVAAEEHATRSRRMTGGLVFCLILQIAMLVAAVVLLIPNFSILILEPLGLSAVMVLLSFLGYKSAISRGSAHPIFKVLLTILMIVQLVVYGVLMLVGFVPELPFTDDTLQSLANLSPIPLLIGMAHAVTALVCVKAADGAARKTHVYMDKAKLDQAKAEDRAEEVKRENAAKAQHAQNQASARAENEKLQQQINRLTAQLAEKEQAIAAFGMLGPSEYDLAGRYWSLIYNETMATGRQVDLNWARWKYGQEENERMLRKSREQREAAEHFSRTITEAYRREEDRQARQDLIRSVDRATEAANELRKKLEE